MANNKMKKMLPPLSFQDSRSASSVMRKQQKLKVLCEGHKQDGTGIVHIHYISENYRLSIQTRSSEYNMY